MNATLVLFGTMEVRWHDQPATFATHAARALLAYLAVEGEREHPREIVAALLWPDHSQAAAYTNLRQTLARLRKALPDPALLPLLQVTSQTLRFNHDVADVDVLRFEQLLVETSLHPHADLSGCAGCLERLQAAVALYRGEFLQGLFLEQSELFGEWLLFKRENLHQQVLAALHTLAHAFEARADYGQMRHYAAPQLTLEPWREEAHSQLMRALASSGDRKGALAQYERCRQVLSDELGMAPSPETVDLYNRIRAGELDATPDPPTPSIKPLKTLPVPLNPLIGREKDITALSEILTGQNHRNARIVTLTGPGGTGKTRLGLQVATALSDHFRDGLGLVNLAPISDTALVLPTIAMSLDVKEVAGEPLLDTLVRNLRDKEILLLLDNFEQVSGAAPQVAHLVGATVGVKVLVTSRMALRVSGEKEYPVPPLALPDTENLPLPEQIMDYEAVAEICGRLDGLPLAIELAAARIRLLTPQAMLSRLKNHGQEGSAGRLALLTGGPKDVAARQQTLRATLDWSHDLLGSEEQQLFRRLAVFAGGRSLEAIEMVCNAGSTPKIDVLDTLESLVRTNLLRQQEGLNGQPRFNMLETIHEFAREKLEESGETAEIQHRHATFFVNLLEDAGLDLHGSKSVAWIERLRLEHDNVRAALEWTRKGMEQGRAEESVIAVRLAAAFWPFWYIRGHWNEGSEWLRMVLSYVEPDPHDEMRMRARARALHGSGALALQQGDYARGQRYFEQSVQAYKEIGDIRNSAVALCKLGDIAYAAGDYDAARHLIEEALTQVRSVDDKARIAAFLTNLGELMRAQGDYAEARRLN